MDEWNMLQNNWTETLHSIMHISLIKLENVISYKSRNCTYYPERRDSVNLLIIQSEK